MTARTCETCAHWGTMGKCNKQSGFRIMGSIRFHQLVTTRHNETCPEHTPTTQDKQP